MQTFISDCLKSILENNKDISNTVFVLPSKRAGVFLKKELSMLSDQTMFLPEITSIEDFIEEVSGIKTLGNLETLFVFYQVYSNLVQSDEKESFESFAKWGQILLHDFNEIDRYRLDVAKFFSNLSDVKQIEHWRPGEEPTTLIKNYLGFWNNAYQFYEALKEELLEKQIGYQGLVYREASENIDNYVSENNKQHYFLGFNALNTSEEIIFQELLNRNLASVFWDTDEQLMYHKTHNASSFLRRYKKNWKYYQEHEFSIVSNHLNEDKEVVLTALAKDLGQAKMVGNLLRGLTNEELKKTAVVLGDEELLLPVLNALPEEVKNVNITMGLSLKSTPITSFFESIFQLFVQQSKHGFYFKNVLVFLNNNYTRVLLGGEVVDTLRLYIQKHNLVNIKPIIANEVVSSPLLYEIWTLESKSVVDVLSLFQRLIMVLKNAFDEDKANRLLELEYLYRFNEVFNKIINLQQQFGSIKSVRVLYQVFREVLSSETLDFKGEPVRGLQIMGMLESRALDFERVIMTSVNEGVLPSGKSHNSFIPFDLKVGFGLPTYIHKDAVYAYHFFRLMQRAGHVTLLYNTEPDGMNAGEKSRFILQLEALLYKKNQIKVVNAGPRIPKERKLLRKIAKNDAVIERLKAIADKGFSPSALTQYIRNPIDFYQQKILRIQEEDMVEEFVAANTLGTIVHNVLEDFYKPLEGTVLNVDLIKQMQKKIDVAIANEFNAQFKMGDISQGKNLIIYNVAKRYVSNFLKQELKEIKAGKQIVIRHIESDLRVQLPIDELNFPVYLTGKVDRIDEVDGVMRIIDYKTGKVIPSEVKVDQWEALTTDYKKYSKSFQVLMYAYMMHQKQPFTASVQGGIISFKNMQLGFIPFKQGRSAAINEEVLNAYVTELKSLILEICNNEVPFEEKEV